MSMNPLPPGAFHYRGSYLGSTFERLASYREQLTCTCADIMPERVLIVGKGDDIVGNILRSLGAEVKTLDIEEELAPDVLGRVENIPLDDSSFDVVMCCQVLEHLPFEKVNGAVRELCRVAGRRVVVSVPDVRRHGLVRVNMGRLRLAYSFSMPRFRAKLIPPGRLKEHGHHWEIGFDGFGFDRVRGAISAPGWQLSKIFRVEQLCWHTFFVLDATARS